MKYQLQIKHVLFIGLLLWIPLLAIRGAFWDSWIVLWAYENKGVAFLFDIGMQVAHAGWIPPYVFFLKVGESYVNELGRLTSIIFHLLNTYLIYLILFKNKFWKDSALLVAIIYVLSPFYIARLCVNFAPFDIYIASYLASILLIHRNGLGYKILGYFLLIISFSFEVLMALEVLRIIYLYEGQKNWKNIVKQVYPIWILCIIFALLRFTVLQPYGIYEGYNSASLSSIFKSPDTITKHALFYIKMLAWNIKIVTDFLTIIGTLILASLCGLLFIKYPIFTIPELKKKTKDQKRYIINIFILCAIFFFIAVLPYAIIGRVPGLGFSNRLLGAGPIAVILIISFTISLIANKKFKYFCVGSGLFIFTMFLVCSHKWAIYDDLIQRDIQRQVKYYTNQVNSSQLLSIKITPSHRKTMYQRRHLTAPDTQLPITFWDGDYHITKAIYSDELRNHYTRHSNGKKICSHIYDSAICPKQEVLLEYVLIDGFKNFNQPSFIKLIKMSLFRKYDDPVIGDMFIIKGNNREKINFSHLYNEIPKHPMMKRIQGYSQLEK